MKTVFKTIWVALCYAIWYSLLRVPGLIAATVWCFGKGSRTSWKILVTIGCVIAECGVLTIGSVLA